jgi:hypothetical protein
VTCLFVTRVIAVEGMQDSKMRATEQQNLENLPREIGLVAP